MRENGIHASVSNTDGTFVCNHVMYAIYYMNDKKYPKIRIAKDALTWDLLKLNLISEDLQKEIRKGKKRWFSVNGFDVSIRVENELKHMERLCKTCLLYTSYQRNKRNSRE